MKSTVSLIRCCLVVLGLASATAVVRAENRFVVSGGAVPVNSTGNSVSVLMDADQEVVSVSLHLEFDPSRVRVNSVSDGAALVAVSPEWSDGVIDNSLGELFWGAVFSISQATIDKSIGPGTSFEVFVIDFDVLGSVEESSTLDLVNDFISVPKRLNVMTNTAGQSINPTLVDSTLSLVDMTPRILSFQNNSGREGASFQAVCEHADRPVLDVTVCGVPASATLRADGQTIDIVAPGCVPGDVEVEICTDLGCDSDPQGFTYLPDPPLIQSFSNNTGLIGATFQAVGQNFDEAGLQVSVCGQPASATLRADQVTIDIVAPDCVPGAAEVEICTNYGCDSDPQGFTYLPPPPPPVIDSFSDNAGPPGTQFRVVGQNFEESGLVVRVCGTQATAVLEDPQTLLVTSPQCGEGPAEVEVCTDHGCDSDPAGYTYPPVPQAPVISSISPASGRAGDAFTIVGDHFDEPGLQVSVCDVAVAGATLRADGITIDVIAPACGAFGTARVEVCTDIGCDVEANGFDYLPPDPPLIESLADNSGPPGSEFTITGQNFDHSGLRVEVCGKPATAALQPDGVTIRVTAPDCDPGFAEIRVCTDFGCDSDATGYTYPEPPPPSIDSLSGNDGGKEGDVFLVVGQNFDQPGLEVTVCDVVAQAMLRPDGVTLEVTAPGCITYEWAAVTVCTNYGCDTEEDGFFYEPPLPIIETIADNVGRAGDVFTIVGQNFDQPGLNVEVCSAPAGALLRSDGVTLEVTAPACGSVGPVAVTVCTDHGCDTDPAGFTYEAAPRFLRGETNGDGGVDLSDGIFILVYLFQGGAEIACLDAGDPNDTGDIDLTDGVYLFSYLFLAGPSPKEPFPGCGEDRTDDDELDCAVTPEVCE